MTRRVIGVLACVAALSGTAAAQGVTDRPPVLSADWVGVPGVVYFNFVHRFSESGAPEHKVVNVPTFLLAGALPWRSLVGVNYATNSAIEARYPNEHEWFARVAPLSQREGSAFDLGAEVAYNDAVRGVDGEISMARWIGPLRLIESWRTLTNPIDTAGRQLAFSTGAVLRINSYIAVAGDVGTLQRRGPDERTPWSVGLQLLLPLTPHTLSIQATNTNAATLQGSSRGTSQVRYGFEFTIPVTLRRYFGRRATGNDSTRATPSSPVAKGSVTVVRIQGMQFRADRVEIGAGTTVEWRNDDPLVHTVTSADGAFQSGPIEPGSVWRHTFEKAGSYAFYCTPHPFMRGVVVVR